MSHPTPILYANATATGGLTVGSLLQALASPDGKAFLAFLGSSILTALSAFIALQTRAVQARVEQARLVRDAAREEELRDAIQALRLARLQYPAGPAPPAMKALPAP